MNIAMRLSSSAPSKSVGASTSGLIGVSVRPSIRWRGKSYVAAQEPSDLPKKRRRRIPLEERKAMVESYVNKYRAINPGKFPTYTEAWKQVGGSYYVVKKLIQELQHQAKISSKNTVETQDEVIKDGKRLVGTHHLSTSNMAIHKNIQDDQTTKTRDDKVSSKEAVSISSVKLPLVVTVQEENPIQRDTQAWPETESAKNDESLHEVEEMKLFQSESDNKKIAENSRESAISSDLPKETKNDESLHEVKEIQFFQSESDVTIANDSCESARKSTNAQFIKTSSSEKMETPSSTGDTSQVAYVIDDKLQVGADDFQQCHKSEDDARMQDLELDKLEPEPKHVKLHQKQKLGTVTRGSSKHQADDAEVANKSNMWDNLKSFADGIFNFFKKR